MLRSWFIVGLLALLGGGCASEAPPPSDPRGLSWSATVDSARGATVDVALWMGDPFINDYMQTYVAPHLKQRYGITLNLISAQGGEIVSALMTEQEAGAAFSAYDMAWINGESFYQLRQIDALYGPFLKQLPNAQYLNLDNPFIAKDFQQPINGMEAPWGNVQFTLIYDTTRVETPPRTRAALLRWVKAHPGQFTFPTGFTGMTLLKMWLIDSAGGVDALDGPFRAAAYRRYAPKLWAYVNRLKPHLWRNGTSFPRSVAQQHQLFAQGAVDFTMSNNDGEVDNKVLQGVFPETAQAYVPAYGSIQNSHYWGIPKRARNKAAALVTINFLLSPKAQLQKLKPTVWGDGTVLAIDSLPAPWPARFRAAQQRTHAPPRRALQQRALPELAPEYMIRLYDDFRTEVLGS
ncbi:ABC transporter substrate-binding protein [Salisaeta longa]|uniref:ABC transporter substrate-binding protein n=1 Tax=Salisaeta longa TaxID=503170 RepID=UPI0003B4F105|nr:ABC transporter substrate-binding protein [Salisaeta longa]